MLNYLHGTLYYGASLVEVIFFIVVSWSEIDFSFPLYYNNIFFPQNTNNNNNFIYIYIFL